MQKRMVKTENILSATQIKAEAARLGFSACGLAPAGPVAPQHAAFFKRWLGEGRQAGMAYMEGHEAKRLDPRLLVEGCRTVVSVALNYHPPTPIPDHKLQIAWYAYGQDYHDIMRQKLNSLLETLRHSTPEGTLQGRAFCDTAPVLERYWAWQCGLGWIGRHTQLVIPRAGSAFFLGELMLNLPADAYDAPFPTDRCGTCRRCIEACPTQALEEGRGSDVSLFLRLRPLPACLSSLAFRASRHGTGLHSPSRTAANGGGGLDGIGHGALSDALQRLCRETGKIRGPHPQPESTARQRG